MQVGWSDDVYSFNTHTHMRTRANYLSFILLVDFQLSFPYFDIPMIYFITLLQKEKKNIVSDFNSN